jgi:acetyl-CoA carboxylase/biotin carboxylase 1
MHGLTLRCSCPAPACRTAAVEHKIETLVGAPAAVEEALASLIVDNQDKYHALQYRALVTYIKRLYFPFLMCEPQVDQHDAVLTATWMFQVGTQLVRE